MTRRPPKGNWRHFLTPDGAIMWDALRMILELGADGRGVTLSPDECAALARIVTGEQEWPTRKAGRRAQLETQERAIAIANHVFLLSQADTINDAVADAEDFFGLSRTAVMTHWSEWKNKLVSGEIIGKFASPEHREHVIGRIREWSKPNSQ
jgi:hypothetical protein